MAQLRSVSSGTDVLSMSARSTRVTLPYAAAPPSYVSAPEAEKLVYAEIERPVEISNGALYLLNGFLDQVLYDILSKSQSITLTAIRAAIPSVLKLRLGRAAVQAGDEELQDYLEEDEFEQIQTTPAVLDPRSEFDVDLAWKLTRLRCMVYAKLGDMEEEDEEDYLEGDDVRDHVSQLNAANKTVDRILPPTAIFLTTVLEFIAEQALCIAAQHARKRHAYLKDTIRDTALSEPVQDTIFLEEIDMSGLGKEGPLIRLWRSWKGSVRLGGTAFSRPTTPSLMSPIIPDSPTQEWRFPTAPNIPPIKEESRSVTPANMPLPMNDNDVEEIEGGVVEPDPVGRADQQPVLENPSSTTMSIMPGQFPDRSFADGITQRPTASRRRSRSVPTSSVSSSGRYFEAGREDSALMSRRVPDTTNGLPQSSSRPHDNQERSGLSTTAMGATVATIAGALSVEAAKGVRRDHPADSAYPVSSLSGPESHSSINTPNDFESMHIPLRAPTAVIDVEDADTRDGTADAEDLALSSSDDEGAGSHNEDLNPRDSGFGVAAPEDEIAQQEHGAVASYQPSLANHHPNADTDQQLDGVAPSNRSSNVGYATIFQAPDANTGYSSSTSTRTSGPGTTYLDENFASAKSSTTPVIPSTSAWPAVIPNRRSSLEQKSAEQDTRFPHQVPSQPHEQNAEYPVPRFATSANARSRSASENQGQARPSTSGSAAARRQHIRLRSEDAEALPREDLDRTKKSLDLLIDSDETLHYTLTPPSATVGSKPKAKSQTQDLADFFRDTVPPGQEARPKSSRSTKEGLNGLRANPPTPVSVRAPPAEPPVSSPSRARNPVGEPREARMVRNNIRDLADYARSTGPENVAQLPKSLGPRPSTAQGSKTESSLRERALGDDSRPNTAKTANRLKYQARDAKVPRTADSSDLIDFIREGPPRAPGEHRIDRHVAPFRTTMDSDDFNALAPPPDLEDKPRNSEASVPESAVTAKSMPSTVNSRTGLLDSTNRTAIKGMNGANSVSKQPAIPERENGMPQRTRRRVRDPYAIDFSDDEDEIEQFEAPPKSRTGEESLVDFLRNTAPTPSMATQPILAAIPGPTQPDASNMVKRSASGSRLRDFLPGGASANKSNGNANDTGATSTPKNVNIARASSPHLTQAGSKMDKYKPTTPTHAAHVERNRTQNKRVEPRGAASTTNGGGTADLAAFLKDSGPPPGVNDKPAQRFNPGVQKDQAGFLKFFQRKGSIRK